MVLATPRSSHLGRSPWTIMFDARILPYAREASCSPFNPPRISSAICGVIWTLASVSPSMYSYRIPRTLPCSAPGGLSHKNIHTVCPGHVNLNLGRNFDPAKTERCVNSVHALFNKRTVGTTLYQKEVIISFKDCSLEKGWTKIWVEEFELIEKL